MGQSENIAKLLSTPEGRQLLQMFSGNSTVQNAGKALKQGDTDGAKSIMEPLLKDPSIMQLIKSLEKTING